MNLDNERFEMEATVTCLPTAMIIDNPVEARVKSKYHSGSLSSLSIGFCHFSISSSQSLYSTKEGNSTQLHRSECRKGIKQQQQQPIGTNKRSQKKVNNMGKEGKGKVMDFLVLVRKGEANS